MLLNPGKIYVNVYNKAVILLLISIYKKNQATVSQKHTKVKDFSRLPNENDDMHSREHIICQQHLIQESWLSIIGLNRPLCHLVKIFQFPS